MVQRNFVRKKCSSEHDICLLTARCSSWNEQLRAAKAAVVEANVAAHGTAICLLQCVHPVASRNTDTSCGIRSKTAFAKMMLKVLCLAAAAAAARSTTAALPSCEHSWRTTAAGAGSFSYLQAADPAAAASQVAATAADAGVVAEIRALGAQVDAGGQTAEHADSPQRFGCQRCCSRCDASVWHPGPCEAGHAEESTPDYVRGWRILITKITNAPVISEISDAASDRTP